MENRDKDQLLLNLPGNSSVPPSPGLFLNYPKLDSWFFFPTDSVYQFSFCKVLKICLLKSNCKLTKLWFPHSLIYRDGLHVSLINKRESWHSSELLHAHNHQAKLVRKEGGSCASTLHSTTGHHTHPLHLLSCQHISISPTPCNFSAIPKCFTYPLLLPLLQPGMLQWSKWEEICWPRQAPLSHPNILLKSLCFLK